MTGSSPERLSSPAEAWSRYFRLPSTATADHGFDYLGAVWARADAFAFLGALARVARMEFSTRAPSAVDSPQLMRQMQGLVLMEGAAEQVLRFAVAAAGVLTALWTGQAGTSAILHVHLRTRGIDAVAAGLIALCIAQRKPRYVFPGFVAAGVLLCTHGSSLPALGAVIAGAGVAWQARWALTRRIAKAPHPMGWVGRRVTGLRYRARFTAASGLAARGRPGVALDVLAELVEAARRRRRPSLATVAAAGCTLIEMDRGNLQSALEHAKVARSLSERLRPRDAVANAVCNYAFGVAQFSLGNYEQTVAVLEAAEPRLRGDRKAARASRSWLSRTRHSENPSGPSRWPADRPGG